MPDICAGAEFLNRLSAFWSERAAVSYTHLDVYKRQERVRHEAETYRVSVLKLTAGRACEYHKLTRAWDLLALAAFIRETVRKSPSSPSGDFRSRLGETERLSTQDFAELSMARFRNDPHVNGCLLYTSRCV